MGEIQVVESCSDTKNDKRNVITDMLNPAVSGFIEFSRTLQKGLKTQLKRLTADKHGMNLFASSWRDDTEGSSSSMQTDLEKQLQCWRENPAWIDQPPVINVGVPKGSLCSLNVNVDIGLPPDMVYNIVTDPDNRRVFKNIKEVVSRKVVVDEGLRQVVEVEQAAMWRFLWWSGTISVHVLVDQNRSDHTMRFKQVKTGFMKRFEGCWKVEPLFVDEHVCDRTKPKTAQEYEQCTGGRGRIGSRVRLDQLIQPEIVPPPPISWYLRGITAKTTEMLIHDLVAESCRIRERFTAGEGPSRVQEGESDRLETQRTGDIKERWDARRRIAGNRRTLRRRRWSKNVDLLNEEGLS